jgi:hypothetical protein
MSTITNFEDLENKMEEFDYDFYAIEFSEEETNLLTKLINSFGEKELSEANRVLDHYYGIKIPENILKEVLSKDILLSFEAYTGGISDTGQREELIDSVLRHIGMSRWPLNMDSEEYKNKFYQELQSKYSLFGITSTN